MGLLDKLWDDTVAGPRPENGLGKLRKYASAPPAPLALDFPVSRSITILKNSRNSDSGSLPPSPVGPSAPDSPFSPTTPRGGWGKFWRISTSSETSERAEPRSPSVYDWIVISALDR